MLISMWLQYVNPCPHQYLIKQWKYYTTVMKLNYLNKRVVTICRLMPVVSQLLIKQHITTAVNYQVHKSLIYNCFHLIQ